MPTPLFILQTRSTLLNIFLDFSCFLCFYYMNIIFALMVLLVYTVSYHNYKSVCIYYIISHIINHKQILLINGSDSHSDLHNDHQLLN